MKEILTYPVECYTLQRLATLLERQQFHLNEIRAIHHNGESYADSPPLDRIQLASDEIQSLLTVHSLLADINRRAARWGAVPPECGSEPADEPQEIPF